MIHTQNEGIYHALLAQLDKLERHNRQGSYKTRQRYYEAMQRFCRFLADSYHLQKLANISGKHLVAYVRHLQENGKAASTIKTELAAIRFWHDKVEKAKYDLPSNADLADQAPLELRKLQGIDRHWTPEQFTVFVTACREADRTDYADIATLTFYVGLRIHEVCRLDTAADTPRDAAQLCGPAVSGSVGWRGYRVPGKVGGVQAAGPRPRRCDERVLGIPKSLKTND